MIKKSNAAILLITLVLVFSIGTMLLFGCSAGGGGGGFDKATPSPTPTPTPTPKPGDSGPPLPP